MAPVVRTRAHDAPRSNDGTGTSGGGESPVSSASSAPRARGGGGIKVPGDKQFYSQSQLRAASGAGAGAGGAGGAPASKKKKASGKGGRAAGKKGKQRGDNLGPGGVVRIKTPHEYDVLSGRGGGINSHPGNKRFRDWVFERKNAYNLAANKNEKTRVAQEVYSLVVTQDPPGRFLMREGGDKMAGRSGGPSLTSLQSISGGRSYWVEIDKAKAMAKTSQALREGAPSIREAAKKEKTTARSSSRRKQSESAKKAKSITSTTSKKKKRTEETVEVGKYDDDSKPASKRSRVFPKLKAPPVPAPIAAPAAAAAMMTPKGAKLTLQMASAAVERQQSSGESGGGMSAADLLTPEQVAAAAEHFRHGTLVGSPIIGRGKEIIMPPPAPPMVPTSGLPPTPPVTLAHPGPLRTESDESRERRQKEEEFQAAEADKQLSQVLHLEQSMAPAPAHHPPTPPPGPYAAAHPAGAAPAMQQGGSALTPTPHLMPISPMISPSYSLGTPGLPPSMADPNFANIFGSPGGIKSPSVPAPPVYSTTAALQSNGAADSSMNRSHSLALSDTNSGNGVLDPQEDFKNVFEDEESNMAYSVGSASGGVVHNYGGTINNAAAAASSQGIAAVQGTALPAPPQGIAAVQGTALPAPPPLARAEAEAANRAIVSPVLTSHPTGTTQAVAPIDTLQRSASPKKPPHQGGNMGRSSHSDTSRSVLPSNVAFNCRAPFMVDPTQSRSFPTSRTYPMPSANTEKSTLRKG